MFQQRLNVETQTLPAVHISMVEGDHATTHINRFIGWMVTSTTLMVVWLDGDLTEFTVDDCSRAAFTPYSSCYRSH